MSLSLEEKINMLPSLRATVEAHGLLAKKALGQNFLLDRNITGKIIRLSLNAQNLSDYRGAAVYEVGPGPGGLSFGKPQNGGEVFRRLMGYIGRYWKRLIAVLLLQPGEIDTIAVDAGGGAGFEPTE